MLHHFKAVVLPIIEYVLYFTIVPFAIILFVIIFFGGCASTDKVYSKLENLDYRINMLERKTKTIDSLKMEIKYLYGCPFNMNESK